MPLYRFYQLIQALSLDVALGAVGTSIFAARQMGIYPAYEAFVSLGLTVWLIYTFDHLMDAKSITGKAITFRHRLHQHYFGPLVGLSILIALANGYFTLQLPLATWTWGLRGGILVATYFLLIQIRPFGVRLAKEPLVALVYVLGVMLPGFSLSQPQEWPSSVFLGTMLFGLAFANLLLFAAFELSVDTKEDHPSIARFLGRKRTLLCANLSSSAVLVAALLSTTTEPSSAIVLIAMALILLLTGLFPYHSAKHDRYRILGDGVFLMPLVVISW